MTKRPSFRNDIAVCLVAMAVQTSCSTRQENVNAKALSSSFGTTEVRIIEHAVESRLAKTRWRYHRHYPHRYTDKGARIEAVAKDYPPIGYTKGMALAYAEVYKSYRRGDDRIVQFLASPATPDRELDALYQFRTQFKSHGIDVTRGGSANLRALFALLYELGVRESDGRYYLGIDDGKYKPDEPHNSVTTEAGLFQSSWNYEFLNPDARTIFQRYENRDGRYWLNVFKEEVPDPENNSDRSIGDGRGREFQELAKRNPRFAVEFAAQTVRQTAYYPEKKAVIGGIKRYFFLRNGFMDINPEAIRFFSEVEKIVDSEE